MGSIFFSDGSKTFGDKGQPSSSHGFWCLGTESIGRRDWARSTVRWSSKPKTRGQNRLSGCPNGEGSTGPSCPAPLALRSQKWGPHDTRRQSEPWAGVWNAIPRCFSSSHSVCSLFGLYLFYKPTRARQSVVLKFAHASELPGRLV